MHAAILESRDYERYLDCHCDMQDPATKAACVQSYSVCVLGLNLPPLSLFGFGREQDESQCSGENHHLAWDVDGVERVQWALHISKYQINVKVCHSQYASVCRLGDGHSSSAAVSIPVDNSAITLSCKAAPQTPRYFPLQHYVIQPVLDDLFYMVYNLRITTEHVFSICSNTFVSSLLVQLSWKVVHVDFKLQESRAFRLTYFSHNKPLLRQPTHASIC